MGGGASRSREEQEAARIQQAMSAEAAARGMTVEQLYHHQNGMYAGNSYPYTVPPGGRFTTAGMMYVGQREILPTPFHARAAPAPQPPAVQQLAYTINNDVHLAKDSLALEPDASDPKKFYLKFRVDAAKPCAITVYFGVKETLDEASLTVGVSSPVRYTADRRVLPKGLRQTFSQKDSPSSFLDLSAFPHDMLYCSNRREAVPILIILESLDSDEPEAPSAARIPVGPTPVDLSSRKMIQSEIAYATLVEPTSATAPPAVKLVHLKLQVGGRALTLEEIYGIDTGSSAAAASADAEPGTPAAAAADSSDGSACVICLVEPRDTTILPCRHMCLCHDCAEALRFQTNKCPICRAPVQSLLQIKFDGAKDSPAPGTPAAPKPAAAAAAAPSSRGATGHGGGAAPPDA